MVFPKEYYDFAGSRAFNKRCELDARGQLGPTRAIFEQLGTTLAPSWSNLEPTWDQLEPSWGQLGANLDSFWGNWDQLEDNLGHYGQLGAIVAPTWATLAPISANLGPNWKPKTLFEITCQKVFQDRCSPESTKPHGSLAGCGGAAPLEIRPPSIHSSFSLVSAGDSRVAQRSGAVCV